MHTQFDPAIRVIRLGREILRVLYDVTNDVIFYLKKLILKPFLHIKGGKYEGSRVDT